MNLLLEEEVEIIEIFNHELTMYGYKGYCSFHENVDNGYFIYKDGNKWIYQFSEKGKITKEKKYTNIYNLCLDITNELKIDSLCFIRRDLIIPRGTRVIITKVTDCPIDELKEGVIVGSEIKRLNYSQSERVYQVLGDDGEIYYGLYGLRMYGDIYFRTMEDYIADSKKQIDDNRGLIQELHELNWDLFLSLSDIIREKENYLEENNNKNK